MVKVGEGNILQQRSLHVVFGNDMNTLADAMAEELFSPLSLPFENRLIVMPNACRKDFLFHRLIHSRLKMAAGVQLLPLNQAVMEILDHSFIPRERKRIPSFLELSLAIEEKLDRSIGANDTFQPLVEYIGSGNGEKKRRRIASLSDELARLFARYGLYGVHFLPQWLLKKGWQQALWLSIFSKKSPWTYPLEALGETPDHYQGKIVLFGFSYISPTHLTFFSKMQASLYQLSPCSMFWEDLTSDKQRLFMGHVLKQKKVKETVREEMDLYMQKSHPLLGNWGRLSREMLKSLDPFVLTEEEVYKEQDGNCLLSSLKRSLLTLEQTPVFHADDSIQLHSATSKLREVEILRDVLENLLHSHNQRGDPIALQEILIASPDIYSYAPYIQMVFSQSSFPFAIEGMPLSSVTDSVNGFLHLFSLSQERFSLASMITLLHCSSFMEKRGFIAEEINQLTQWFKQAQIRRDLTGNPNSWEEGIDRLLYGLALNPKEEEDFDSWPIACIPHSEIDLFNRFLELFLELKNDHLIFKSKKECSAAEWLELFLQLADKYFVIEWEREPFFQELRSLCLSCRALSENLWNFERIQRVLHSLAQKLVGAISSPKIQKITFTPLSLGNLCAARIIGCLGMDETAYPRSDPSSSLCEMRRHNAIDYIPLKTDEDRALFLKLLITAEDYLLFSYQRIHAEDGKHQEPSLLIEELNQYLSKNGLERGVQKIDHPAFPFDPAYFASDPTVEKSTFFPEIDSKAVNPQEMIIDIRQLKKLARNPFQFYFNETLGIYLKKEEEEEETEFLISRLHKSLLRKEALGGSLAQVMRRTKAEGKLPRGLFQEAAAQNIEEEMADLFSTLKAFEIQPHEIISVHFSLSCQQKEKKETLIPPLAVQTSVASVYLTGVLENVTPKGLLFNGENNLKDLVKAWPLYLIYCCLYPENQSLLLTKKGTTVAIPIANPQEALASYIDYFLLAQQTPSLLMPDFAKSLLKGTAVDLKIAMEKDSIYEDPYLNYLKRRHGLPSPEASFALWHERLKRVFAHLINQYN